MKNNYRCINSILQGLIVSIMFTFFLNVFIYFLTKRIQPNQPNKDILIILLASVVLLVTILIISIIIYLIKRNSWHKRVIEAGIKHIMFSRDGLLKYSPSIGSLIERTTPNTTILVVCRSAIVWANEYQMMEKAINEKNITIKVVIADPTLKGNDITIIDDHGKGDIKPALEKFSKIRVNENSFGNLEVYLIPIYVLTSFTYYYNNNDEEGILEFGADMAFHKRISIVLKSGKLLSLTKEMYFKVIKKRYPIDFAVLNTSYEE